MHITAIAAKHLACQRGGEIVVGNVNFEVSAGRALLLRGPNGSGKTTLLRTMAGFLAPAAGQIIIRQHGKDTELQPEALHHVGHANGIKSRLSVLENVQFWQQYYRDAGAVEPMSPASWFETARPAPPHHEAPPHPEERPQAASRRMRVEKLEAALDAFGLLHLAEYRAAHLSQGQARRLGLARLLAAKRPVWLLDEPSVSLDAASTRLLETAIAAHLSGGGIALIATHGDLEVPNAGVLHLGGKAAA